MGGFHQALSAEERSSGSQAALRPLLSPPCAPFRPRSWLMCPRRPTRRRPCPTRRRSWHWSSSTRPRCKAFRACAGGRRPLSLRHHVPALYAPCSLPPCPMRGGACPRPDAINATIAPEPRAFPACTPPASQAPPSHPTPRHPPRRPRRPCSVRRRAPWLPTVPPQWPAGCTRAC